MPDDRLVVIQTCDTRPEADVLKSLLEAYGIPVYLRDGGFPGVGGVTEVNRGFQVMVPVAAEADARDLLKSGTQPES